MKRIRSKYRARWPGRTQHYGSSLLALESAQKRRGVAEHFFNGEWVEFKSWPIQERLAAQQADYETQWRERKSMHPYGLTEAGYEAGGRDALHAMGLTLVELERLGLLME